jgi:PAS domain S-box-containing protein
VGALLLWLSGAFAQTPAAPGAPQPPITSGCEVDYPPFCIVHEDGRVDGFSVELLRATLAAMGREVTFRSGPWTQVKGWLERGEVQALPLVGRTPEREAAFDFTVPYLTMHGAVVVREDSRDVRSLSDLGGRRVAALAGDNAEEFLRRTPRDFNILTAPTLTAALQLLAAGSCDAVVAQRLVALRLLQTTGMKGLRVVNQPIEGFRQDFSFAVRDGDRDTLALLNEGLALTMADGTYRHLHAKWFAAMELPPRRLVVGGDRNYPPFEYLDQNGRPAGYNVDLTRAIAAQAGLDVEIRLGPWAEMVGRLESGEIDALQGMFYSPQREIRFDFTPAHTVSHYVSVVRRGTGRAPATMEELAGKRLVLQDGDIMHDVAVQSGLGASITTVPTQEEALRELAAGRYDCALVNRAVAQYLIPQHHWDNLVVGSTPLLSPEYCYAAPNGSRALLAQLSDGLKAIEENGEYHRIHEKWMGIYDQGSARLSTVLRYVAVVVLALVLVLLAVLLWSRSLHRQVAQRTGDLAALARRQEALLAAVPDIIMEVNRDHIYTWANPAGVEFFGADVLGQEAGRYFVGDQDVYQKVQALFDGNESVIRLESLQRRQDGEGRLLAWWCRVLKDEAGRVCGALSSARDITEQKRADEALRESEDRFKYTFESANVGKSITLPGGGIHVNRAFAELLGYTREELRGKTWQELTPADDIEDMQRLIAPLLRGERDSARFNKRYLHRNGSTVWADVSVAIRRDAEGRPLHFITTVVDITERKQAEEALAARARQQAAIAELGQFALIGVANTLAGSIARQREEEARRKLEAQLAQAQKMESIGRLAGGVAHDFNNLLMGIMNYVELSRGALPADHPVRAWLDDITSDARRSAEITRQLLAFARIQTVSPEVLDLNEAMAGMLRMLRRLIGEDIDLAWMPGANLRPVQIDPSQVDQVLANLCVNARDAIGDTGRTGRISIETANVTIATDDRAGHPGFTPGAYVRLTVSDNGSGMNKETQAHVFEPFFTTKATGMGTGLGLATVYGIVTQNHGQVSVTSEPGKGTTFSIHLPAVDGETAPTPAADTTPVPKGHGETVLLVEDEKSLRVTCGLFLKALGYAVVVAESPAAAQAIAAQHQGAIDLLLTDVVMPGMDGRRLANMLVALKPGMKTLFMSGYTADVIAHHGVLDAEVPFIGKPFSRDELARKVRLMLDGG